MEESRLTKFSNEILFNLFKDYTVQDIKILTAITNRLITRYKAIENNEADEENKDALCLGVSLDFIFQYKGERRLSVKEIDTILKKICSFGVRIKEGTISKMINIVKEAQYDERYKSFKIIFNENALEYLILIDKNFTLLDLNMIKSFSSKYELGLYILIKMYKGTGTCIKRIEDLKEYFNVKGSPNDLMKYIRKAIQKLNDTYKYKIKVEEEKVGKRINVVRIKFRINI